MSTFVIGDVHGRRAQLRQLLGLLPRDPARDTLVLLGDLVDRGTDIPGTVEDVVKLVGSDPLVRVVRGNHEQMLLDFLDEGAPLWLHPAVGGDRTIEQYTGEDLDGAYDPAADTTALRRQLARALPAPHLELFRRMPLFHEDDYALYVHAGLVGGRHPRDTDPHQLLWTRNPDFYKHYHGKPCIFGHTPTPLLPLLGRIGRHGIYISHSAIGIDTGYGPTSPLSCIQLPEFNLYQTFPNGRTAHHHITTLIPEHFRTFRPHLPATSTD